MNRLVNHARKMVEESDMTLDAKMEVLDFLVLKDILELKEYRKLGSIEELRIAKEEKIKRDEWAKNTVVCQNCGYKHLVSKNFPLSSKCHNCGEDLIDSRRN